MTSFRPQPYRIADAVLPGETVRWTGIAPRGFRFRALDAVLVPFSLMWFGFALAMEIATWPNFLFGIPFVAVGAYFFVGRFLADMYLRAHTTYALTDVAAYIVREGPLPAVRRYAGNAIDSTTFEPLLGGRGTIRFVSHLEPFATWGSFWGRRNGFSFWQAPTLDAFYEVPNGRDVWAMVVAIRRVR